MNNLTFEQLKNIYEPLKAKFLSNNFMLQKELMIMNKALYLITAKKYDWKH